MELNIIPAPKKINIEAGEKKLCRVPAKVCVDAGFAPAAEAFSAYMGRAGIDVAVSVTEAEKLPGQGIVIDGKTEPGSDAEYSVIAAGNILRIIAIDISGVNHALATVAQLTLSQSQPEPGIICVPECEIYDTPDCSYRGLMVDLARYFHPYEILFAYIDACWFYKLSTLHLHFTDDQSYTLPSELFPRLSTEGKSYTFDEIRSLCEYARARGVELMPEIDVPGHNASFTAAYPELFGTNGIICRHHDSTKAICNLFSELCDMFPYSGHIHIGGDEANLKNWLKCEKCMQYAKNIGIDTENLQEDEICDRLYVDFIVRVSDAVKAKGRTPVVWEGFPKYMNDIVPRDIIVMSWENYYQITPDLLDAGFTIINCSWNPMYIVAPDVKWTPEEICGWSIYKWRPVHPGSPFAGSSYECAPTDNVTGGQLLAWGDRVVAAFGGNETKGAYAEFRLILERLPYLSQNTWNKTAGLVYNELSGSVEKASAALEKMFDEGAREELKQV